MKKHTLIKKINKELPEAMAINGADFDKRHKNGIWFSGSESIASDGQIIFDYYEEYTQDTMGIHPTLYKILDEAGWYGEPYDAGTLMAWEN
jgi:hypothetical protein